MTLLDASLAVLRFGQYAALMLLLGSAAFPLLVLRGRPSVIADPWRRRTLAGMAAMAILLALAAMASSVAAMMGQMPWQLDPATIHDIIAGTSMGWAFLVRTAALVAALVAAVLIASRRTRAWAVGCLTAVALATLAWSGHAAATTGPIGTLHRLSSSTHLIAASLWIGAIGGLLLLTLALESDASRQEAAALLGIAHDFAPVGIVLVGIVSITGLANAELIFGLANWPMVLTTSYGILLAAKLALVMVMLLCAARNASIGRRYAILVGRPMDQSSSVPRSLQFSLALEAAAATAVLAAVAVLGTLSPADWAADR